MYFPYMTVYPEVIASTALFAHCTRSETLSFFLFQHALSLDLFFFACDVCHFMMAIWTVVQGRLMAESNINTIFSLNLFHLSGKGKLLQEWHGRDPSMIYWPKLGHSGCGKIWEGECPVLRCLWQAAGGHHCERLLSLPVTSAVCHSNQIKGSAATEPGSPATSSPRQHLHLWGL